MNSDLEISEHTLYENHSDSSLAFLSGEESKLYQNCMLSADFPFRLCMTHIYKNELIMTHKNASLQMFDLTWFNPEEFVTDNGFYSI